MAESWLRYSWRLRTLLWRALGEADITSITRARQVEMVESLDPKLERIAAGETVSAALAL